jgi:hypothetical protein
MSSFAVTQAAASCGYLLPANLQGPDGKLAETAPSLQQLDLTDNLIGSWATVLSICKQLPGLQLLNLSLNMLQLPCILQDSGVQQLPGLRCLVLNQCNITWQQVWRTWLLYVCRHAVTTLATVEICHGPDDSWPLVFS